MRIKDLKKYTLEYVIVVAILGILLYLFVPFVHAVPPEELAGQCIKESMTRQLLQDEIPNDVLLMSGQAYMDCEEYLSRIEGLDDEQEFYFAFGAVGQTLYIEFLRAINEIVRLEEQLKYYEQRETL